MTTRLSINISDDVAAYLKDRSAAQGVTVTEVVRQAVALDNLLRREIGAGGTITIATGKGRKKTYRELVIV